MAEPMRRPAGWEDILAASEDLKAEVVDGELHTLPRPRFVHGLAQSSLSSLLGPPFAFGRGGPGGWWLVTEPDVAFGPHDIVGPDLVGWRKARMPVPPTERPITLDPDWICEVLSPSTARRDRLVKADLYLRAGVPHYWLIDPEARLLEAYESQAGRWVRLGGWESGPAAIPPFEAVEIDVTHLFPPEPPEAAQD